MEESRKMAKIACAALADKKGEDIKLIDISNVSVLADYFIIANGTNDSQVHAITLKQREGYGLGSWVLLDFGEVIVHVFDKENRLFYDLERIWSDGKMINIEEL